jgi:hypothetical protein
MSKEYLQKLSPKRQQAVAELTGMIRQHYPDTTFAIGPGEDDPQGTYITATVDVDDPDVVTDLTIDRELGCKSTSISRSTSSQSARPNEQQQCDANKPDVGTCSGQPLYSLLSGKHKDTLRLYTTAPVATRIKLTGSKHSLCYASN